MTDSIIWNYKHSNQTIANRVLRRQMIQSIENKINQDNGKLIYVHKVYFCIGLMFKKKKYFKNMLIS